MDHVIPKCTAAPTIIRSGTRRNFTVLSHTPLEDRNLKGLPLAVLVYLLGKPDDWQVRPTDIMARFELGRNSVYNILKDLVRTGYAERRMIHEGGRIARWELLIFDTPRCPNGVACEDPQIQDLESEDVEIGHVTKKEEDLPRIETTRAFVQPDAAPSPEWTNELKGVKATLDEFNAPDGFYDLAFWAKIAAAYGPLPDVYYIDELRKYLLWWHAQPPSRRRKAVTRSFTTWLRTEEARAAARAERAREREATNGYHQARR